MHELGAKWYNLVDNLTDYDRLPRQKINCGKRTNSCKQVHSANCKAIARSKSESGRGG